MIIHFATVYAAETHLTINGWRQIENAWVSRDGTCAASIHPITGSDVVHVAFREIQMAA